MYLAIPNSFPESRKNLVKFRVIFKKQWSYFTTHWPEYLRLVRWWVYPRSSGPTLPHIGLNTFSWSNDECVQEAVVLPYHTLAWILAPAVMSVYKKQWSYTLQHIGLDTCSWCMWLLVYLRSWVPLYHILAWILAPALMMSVSKKQWSYFTTYWPEYLRLVWWWVCQRSRGPTLPHISLNTCSWCDDRCI